MTITTRQYRGFTLLEVVLAMLMTTILAASLYGAMSVAIKGKRSAEAAVRPARVAAIACDLAAQDLQSALPPNGVLAGAFTGTQTTGPDGRADVVDCYCVGEDAVPSRQTNATSEGIRHVRVLLRTDVSPMALVRRVERNLLTDVAREPEEEVLCRSVRSFAARYFDGTTWQDDWDSTTNDNALPLAVELTLAFDKGDGTTRKAMRFVTLPCVSAPTADVAATPGGGQ
jgi:prepilin-type N-terminal cleavage/methylation domain-containing protein